MGIVTLILIAANVVFSYKGLRNRQFIDKYCFSIDAIRLFKDYKRFVTSGFVHANWPHLIFNMMALYFIGPAIENAVGPAEYLVIYFAALIGGEALVLILYKHYSGYSSLGASGAVMGIFFAFIALFPSAPLALFPLPISFPAWMFGIAYTLFSIYGIQSRKGNVGHEAHLCGALTGMFIAILFHPSSLLSNYWAVLLIAGPAIGFIYIIITRPHVLLIDSYFFRKQKHHYSIDHQYNEDRHNKQKEIDRILDKIGKKGMGSLSRDEKKRLEDYSKS